MSGRARPLRINRVAVIRAARPRTSVVVLRSARRHHAADPPRRAADPPRRAADPPRRAADPPRRAADPPRRAADLPRRAADLPRRAIAFGSDARDPLPGGRIHALQRGVDALPEGRLGGSKTLITSSNYNSSYLMLQSLHRANPCSQRASSPRSAFASEACIRRRSVLALLVS